MCRSIQRLYNVDPPVTDDEVQAAARQFVRKISGSTKPSQANSAIFEQAIDEITEASRRLLGALVSNAPPQDREAEAERRRLTRQRQLAASERR
jgi:hypothetical protein